MVVVRFILFGLSIAFYYVWRGLFKILASIDTIRTRHGKDEYNWATMREVCKQPQALAFTMVVAPRWNCHALIGKAGPFPIKRNLAIEPGYLEREEGICFIVVYNRDFEVVHLFDSRRTKREKVSHAIELPEGLYFLSYRGYSRQTKYLPKVMIDGQVAVPEMDLEGEFAKHEVFLGTLSQRRSWIYLACNYYIYVMLKYPEAFSKSFIESEYMPVSNPGTRYLYGQVDQGKSIEVTIAEERFEDALYFITVYDLHSLPQLWESILSPRFTSRRVEHDGYYLIRIQAIDPDESMSEINFIEHSTTVAQASAVSSVATKHAQ
jgi:hypothetical protein